MKVWIMFVLGVILCWGMYVVSIHMGQKAIGGKSQALWSFLWVGVAYFLVAVLIPAGILAAQGELTNLPAFKGIAISTGAGVLGAVGALCLILAMMYGGKPLYVAPLVFAGAPLVNTMVTMALHPPAKMPSPLFFVGILVTAGGAAMVLVNKPAS